MCSLCCRWVQPGNQNDSIKVWLREMISLFPPPPWERRENGKQLIELNWNVKNGTIDRIDTSCCCSVRLVGRSVNDPDLARGANFLANGLLPNLMALVLPLLLLSWWNNLSNKTLSFLVVALVVVEVFCCSILELNLVLKNDHCPLWRHIRCEHPSVECCWLAPQHTEWNRRLIDTDSIVVWSRLGTTGLRLGRAWFGRSSLFPLRLGGGARPRWSISVQWRGND